MAENYLVKVLITTYFPFIGVRYGKIPGLEWKGKSPPARVFGILDRPEGVRCAN